MIKYAIAGLVVMVAAHFIPKVKLETKDLFYLGLAAAVALYVVDMLAPRMGFGGLIGQGSEKVESFAPIQHDPRWENEYMRPPALLPAVGMTSSGGNVCWDRPPTHVQWPLYGTPNPHGLENVV